MCAVTVFINDGATYRTHTDPGQQRVEAGRTMAHGRRFGDDSRNAQTGRLCHRWIRKMGLGYPGSEGDANMQGFDTFMVTTVRDWLTIIILDIYGTISSK